MTGEKQMTENLTNDSDSFVVRQPLKLYKSKRRRYVRVEISAPVSYIGIDLDRPLTELQEQQAAGTILNISGGGVLIAGEQQVAEDDYVSLTFELRECGLLNGIVGKVKRIDEDGEGGYLMGVEFCSEDKLAEVFGSDAIGTHVSSFDEKVKRTLLRYIFEKKVDAHIEQLEEEEE
jgi:c-di-GMP-binding flagellar brake protein YcgR